MKTLVTHINPHLDDIAAIWLFRKFHPEFAIAQIEFVSASHNEAIAHHREEKMRLPLGGVSLEDRVFVGTGGGRFDEHKEGLDTCAASLVYEYLKEKGYIPKDEKLQNALEKLMAWNLLIDTGKALDCQFDEFSVQSFVRTKDNLSQSSSKSVELGSEILNRILAVLKRKEQSLLDWEKRVEFESKFGKSFAVSSETVDREFCREQEGNLFIMYDPKYKSVQFFTPHEIDLEPIYKKVKEVDPKASWFLHQSHHMVICGSSSAPDSKSTKLSIDQLIEAAKS